MINALLLSERLEQLLGEPLEQVRTRQRESLAHHLGGETQPFVLFGAGNLGRHVLTTLERKAAPLPLAILDNNPKLWGTRLHGIEVSSPQEIAKRYKSQMPSVITTIWCGEATDSMEERLAPLRALGFTNIALFGHLAWRHPEDFLPLYSLDLPEKVILDADRIRQAYRLLSDDESRQIFVNHIAWRLHLDYDLLPPASPLPIYFNDRFITRRTDEILYDIGAFTGDSVQAYLDSRRPYRAIHSFEPSPDNFKKLEETLARLATNHEGLHAYQCAVGNHSGSIALESGHGPSTQVGWGDQLVPMRTLDELSLQLGKATFIKMDIEGFEPQCLAGGRRSISDGQPALAVCVYHRQDHLWNIILQLDDYAEGYHFHLCPHLNDGWDLVLYAVPPARTAFPTQK